MEMNFQNDCILEKKTLLFPGGTYFSPCGRERKTNTTSVLISAMPMIFIFGLAKKYQFFIENEYSLSQG